MNSSQKFSLINQYIEAYNVFDIEKMLSLVSDDIHFQNISNGSVNAETKSKEEFANLAAQSKDLFSWRKQDVIGIKEDNEKILILIDFEAELACDFPNGMKKGEKIHIEGKSEFEFRSGKISKITDIS